MTDRTPRGVRSGAERLLHWTAAAATLVLIASGWEIYNAAPFWPLTFPGWATLGGDLTAALLWHFAAMWAFAAALLLTLLRRFVLRRGVPLTPVRPSGVVRDLRDALTGRLGHDLAAYNHVQRLLYLGVLALMALVLLSGLALWKPVQLAPLTEALGGYEAARRWHFLAMAGIASFVVVHVAMAVLVPRTIGGMLFGIRVDPTEEGRP